MESTRGRVSLSTQLREHCRAHNISYAAFTQNGRLIYRIDGELLTVEQAANRFLSGGFAESFGREEN